MSDNPDFDCGGHALAREMRNAKRLEEERANDPAKNWLVSVSNFILYTVFGLAILSFVLSGAYVVYRFLRGLLTSG